MMRSSVCLFLFGAIFAFAGCENEPESSVDEEEIASAEQAICSAQQVCPNGQTISCGWKGSQCTADQDAGGLYVMCGTMKTYCGGPPPCTCGSTEYEFLQYGVGWSSTCAGARENARQLAIADAQVHCPYGTCNATLATACELAPGGGYVGEVEHYYHCESSSCP